MGGTLPIQSGLAHEGLADAELLYELGQIREARKAFEAHMRGASGRSLWYCHYGVARCIMWTMGRTEAISVLIGLTRNSSAEPIDRMRAHRHLAEVGRLIGRIDLMQRNLERAQELQIEHDLPDLERILNEAILMRTLLLRREYGNALDGSRRLLEETRELNPRQEALEAEQAVWTARILAHSGEPDEALGLLNEYRIRVIHAGNLLTIVTMSTMKLYLKEISDPDPKEMERRIETQVLALTAR